ncbi:MAG TPA: hypothetical protein VF572_06330 [Candidatus Saccharimonadales bacterium]|jgi:hypothetical protein
MSIKELAIGAVVTVVIGGSAYTINQADVVSNFAADTGMSQQQAEEYVQGVDEKDLVPFDQLGADYIKEGEDTLKVAAETDCVNYEYEWESVSLSCYQGKTQIEELGKDTVALGNAYKKLGSATATKEDMSATINVLDEVNSDYGFEIMDKILTQADITEVRNNNSYNKSLLKAALASE